MNVIHVLLIVCVGMLIVCWFLLISFLKLYINCTEIPLFLARVHMVFHSCCSVCSVDT